MFNYFKFKKSFNKCILIINLYYTTLNIMILPWPSTIVKLIFYIHYVYINNTYMIWKTIFTSQILLISIFCQNLKNGSFKFHACS